MVSITALKDAKRGISAENRTLLSNLHRFAKGPITVKDAIDILNLPKERVSKLLPYLASSGWLKRIKRGTYLLIPLEARSPTDWTENDWVIAAKIFDPAYIGGWSAANHWGFTDQLFNSTVVFTTHKVRNRNIQLGEFSFVVRTVKDSRFYGLQTMWKDQSKVMVSDPTRTIVDILDTPSLGGGIRHAAEVISNYFLSSNCDEDKLLEYIEKFDNRAIYKRLGYLIESLNIKASSAFIEKLSKKVNRGLAYIDPELPHNGERNKKWNLVVNANFDSIQ